MSVFTRVGEPFRRTGQWVKNHRLHTIVTVGVVLIAGAGASTYFLLSAPLPLPKVQPIAVAPKPKPPAPKYYSLLDGTQVASQSDLTAPVTAIMIENTPQARPQSGLKQAQVVYEAIAEGGITRFMALYQQNKPQMIGPVRSLRMYYLDWAAPYHPSIVHVGGSLYSLQDVSNGNYRNIDIEHYAGASWRATDRYAPHNVYTTFARLDALNSKLGYTSSTFTSFPRVDGQPAATPNASTINVHMSGPLYDSQYLYNPATNNYNRYQDGAPHLDREDGQISPSVVIVLKVNMTLVMQDGYREDITTTGSGEADIFQNGTVQTATWSKAGRMDPLQLLDKNGQPISLVRGQTWIVALPNSVGTVSWQ